MTVKPERPLSPHLQIYKPQLTSMLSILHRITGVALCVGLAFVAWWAFSLSQGADAFAAFKDCITHPAWMIFFVGWVFSLSYHALNGVRHLFWDMGYFLDLKGAYITGWLVVFASLAITAIVFLF